MNDKDKGLIDQYGITCESKIIYRYKEHRYENIKDAVNYAKLDTAKNQCEDQDITFEK